MKRASFIFFLVIMVFSLNGFQDNEILEYKIKYGVISAAQAKLTIASDAFKDTIDAYRITAETRTNSVFDKIFKVRDFIESYWRKKDLVSLRFTKRLSEGNYRQYRIHHYYPEQNLSLYMKYGHKTQTFKEKKIEIPDRTQDIFSAFYWLRTQKFNVGDSILINVTVDGDSYVTQVNILKKETIDTIFGKTECYKIEPILKGEAIFKQTGRVFIWLTADEQKIPVLLESKIIFGSFRAILEKASNVSRKLKG